MAPTGGHDLLHRYQIGVAVLHAEAGGVRATIGGPPGNGRAEHLSPQGEEGHLRVSVNRDVESELKYELQDERVGERLLGAEHLGRLSPLGPVDVVRHDDRYFDTPSGALAAAGYAARLRQTPEDTLLAIKSLQPPDAALHVREELETPVPPVLDTGGWPPSDARALIVELTGDAELVETVRLRQLRRKRRFGDSSTSVEVSLDSVEVQRDGATVDAFVELEVELVRGAVRDLEPVARALDRVDGLTAARSSKLERALAAVRPALAGPPTPSPAPPKSPGVTSDDAFSEAGRKVLRFHFDRMVAREKGTRAAKDPEELHAMRVATRRLRAAWRVFGDTYRTRKTRHIRRSLGEVAERLGAVRDLDVLLEAAEQYAANLSAKEQAGVKPLFDAWRRRRAEARHALIEELDSAAYRELLEEFRAFLADDSVARPVKPNRPQLVRDTAPAAIWAAYHRVRAYDGGVRWADLETLHALRIEAKRLRYSLEFFREALGPEAGELIRPTVELQDHLGALHDFHVAAELTRQFLLERAGELDGAEADAVGRYLLNAEREVTWLRRSVGSPWRGVSGARFRRGLGQVLARL